MRLTTLFMMALALLCLEGGAQPLDYSITPHCELGIGLPLQIQGYKGRATAMESESNVRIYGDTLLSTAPVVMIIQVQRGTIDSNNTVDFGDGPGGLAGRGSLSNEAGYYEFNMIESWNEEGGNLVLTLRWPLSANYTEGAAGEFTHTFQVIQVPFCYRITLHDTVTVPAWNGEWGGVAPLLAQELVMESGAVLEASGAGYRGAPDSNQAFPGIGARTDFAITTGPADNVTAWARKGESYVGTPTGFSVPNFTTYPGGLDGAHGAPGNAGGGGNALDSAGGGGANAGDGGVGGRNGANYRGGLGGVAVNGTDISRLFMGGGGGAGARNNPNRFGDCRGLSGGGIIYVHVNEVISVEGTFRSSGAPAVASSQADGGGGGGAGGTVVLLSNVNTASAWTSAEVIVTGGDGSTMETNHPAGGGGGGGFIYTSSASLPLAVYDGGLPGTSGPNGIVAQPGSEGILTVNSDALFLTSWKIFQAYAASVTPTSSVTPTPSASSSSSPSITPTPSSSPSSSVTPTPSVTPTSTSSDSSSVTPSSSSSSSPSSTPSPSASVTPTGTPTPSSSVTGTPSSSPTSSVTPTGTGTRTPTSSSSSSVTPTGTRTRTPTASSSSSVTPTGTASSSRTSTPSVTPTGTGTRTSTGTPSSSVTPTRTPSVSPTGTSSVSPTMTRTPTASPSVTPTGTPTRTRTPTSSSSATATRTPSNTQTPTQTPTGSQTPSPSPTSTSSPSSTPSSTASRTASVSISLSSTSSRTATPSSSVSRTLTPTRSPTASVTGTASVTRTPTRTSTPSVSVTRTTSPSSSVSFVPSSSATTTRSPSSTPTPSSSVSGSSSMSPSSSPTISPTISTTSSITPSTSRNNLVGPPPRSASPSVALSRSATKPSVSSIVLNQELRLSTPTRAAGSTIAAQVAAPKINLQELSACSDCDTGSTELVIPPPDTTNGQAPAERQEVALDTPTGRAGTLKVPPNIGGGDKDVNLEVNYILGPAVLNRQSVGQTIIQVTLSDPATGSNIRQLNEPLTICIDQSTSHPGTNEKDLCLSYYDEDTGEWLCQDDCLEMDNDGLLCGDTPHLTNFALLLSPGAGDKCQAQTIDKTVAWLTVGATAAAVLFVLVAAVVTEYYYRQRRYRQKRLLREISRQSQVMMTPVGSSSAII